MATEIKVSIEKQPEPATDGSGLVILDMKAFRVVDGETWTELLHQDMNIPSDELKAALDQPTNATKIAGIKAVIRDNVTTPRVSYTGWPTPPSLWNLELLNAYADAYDVALAEFEAINDAAALEALRLDEFATVTLNLDYPIRFVL